MDFEGESARPGKSFRRFRIRCGYGNLLSRHRERGNKGGDALIFADSELSGKRNGVQLCRKLKKAIRRVFAVAIDVDGGCTVESLIARLRALGVFGIVHTHAPVCVPSDILNLPKRLGVWTLAT